MIGPEGVSRPLLVVWAAQLDLAISLILLVAALVVSGALLVGWVHASGERAAAPLTLRSSLWLAFLLVVVAYCVASIVNAMDTLGLLPAALSTHQVAHTSWATPAVELLGVAVPSLLTAIFLAYLAVNRWLRSGERTP